MLTTEQIDFYRDNGYLAVPDVLSADEVAELRQTTDQLVEASRQVTDHTDVYDLEPGHSAAEPRVRRIKSPNQRNSRIQQRRKLAGQCMNVIRSNPVEKRGQ